MSRADPFGDVDLILAMRRGDRSAAAAFEARHANLLFQICRSVTPTDVSARAAFDEVLDCPALGDLFGAFDGRASISAFAAKVVVDGILFPRLLRLMGQDARAGFVEFEAFFHRRVQRLADERIGNVDLRKDAVQWIFEQIQRNHCEQITAWAHAARTAGFIVRKLQFLVGDFSNSLDAPAEGRRRQLPEPVKDLPGFDQAVFRQAYWKGSASAADALLGLASTYPEASEQAVREARARIDRALSSHPQWRGYAGRWSVADTEIDQAGKNVVEPGDDAEDPLEAAERGRQQADFRAALLKAAGDLGPREKLYLLKFLQGKPARVIAEEMRVAVQEVYKLGPRVIGKLQTRLIGNPAAKNLIASVTGQDAFLETGSFGTGSARPRPAAGQKGSAS